MKIDIKSLEGIPFGKELIVTGNVNKIFWVWRVPGMFIMNDGAIIFENIHGTTITADENINIAILTEDTPRGNSARREP